jgi:hypothetical protein
MVFSCLFRENKPKGKFILNPTIEVIGYLILKKNSTEAKVERHNIVR